MKKPLKQQLAKVRVVPSGPVPRQFGNAVVPVEAVYHVKDIAPKSVGPWNKEAEKVAWTDPRTGYGCIIRRSPRGGHLCGYVGVGPEHPIYGYSASACREVGIRAHGGLNYAKECEKQESEKITRVFEMEERSVCHVVIKNIREIHHTTKEGRTVLEVKPHDDLWWIGFECNLPTDIIPDPTFARKAPSTPTGTVIREYRDEAYVFDQCMWVAEQLQAVAAGRDPGGVPERWTPAASSVPPKAVR